jgi:hypothetical protein
MKRADIGLGLGWLGLGFGLVLLIALIGFLVWACTCG